MLHNVAICEEVVERSGAVPLGLGWINLLLRGGLLIASTPRKGTPLCESKKTSKTLEFTYRIDHFFDWVWVWFLAILRSVLTFEQGNGLMYILDKHYCERKVELDPNVSKQCSERAKHTQPKRSSEPRLRQHWQLSRRLFERTIRHSDLMFESQVVKDASHEGFKFESSMKSFRNDLHLN